MWVALKEWILLLVIIGSFTIYMVVTYNPRLERDDPKVYTVLDVDRNHRWELDEFPKFRDGFVRFHYNEYEDVVWIPRESVRIYEQVAR